MKAKFAHLNAHLDLRWKSDFQKDVIVENFKDRNWEPVEEEDGTSRVTRRLEHLLGLCGQCEENIQSKAWFQAQ